MKRRRNPSSSSALPLMIAGAGVALMILGRQQAAPVNGLDGWGSKIKKKAKKATKSVTKAVKAVTHPVKHLDLKDAAAFAAGGGIVQAGKMGVSAFKRLPSSSKALLTGGVTALGIKKVVTKVKRGRRAPKKPVAPGEVIEYQDENGNVITQAEYERRQALYEQESACKAKGWAWGNDKCAPLVSDPLPPPGRPGNRWGQDRRERPVEQEQQPAAPTYSGGGGGGGGASDYYGSAASETSIMPPAEATPEPSSAEVAAPPAPGGKMNPLIAVGAFAAVPLIFGLMGDN